MSSSINPNNINAAYPVAARDNDSQGFRDNFTNIKSNLTLAKEEIEEIQEKAIFKSSLTGETLDNDMDGETISNLTLLAPKLAITDHGSYLSGTVTIDLSAGTYHKISVEGDISLSITNAFPAGEHTSFYLEMETNGAWDVTLPVISSNLTFGTQPRYLDENVFTLPANTTHLYHLISTDAGTTWMIIDCLWDHKRDVPSSAVGIDGDEEGDITADGTYLYICTADYDGSTDIWIRMSHGAATW